MRKVHYSLLNLTDKQQENFYN